MFGSLYVKKAAEWLQILVLIGLSLYVLNVAGNIDAVSGFIGGRRYLNVLWIVLAAYLLSSRFDVNREFFIQKFKLLLPISLVCVFLYFYHDRVFDVGYVKYGLLLVLTASAVVNVERFTLRSFFWVNSAACVVIYLAALYQVLLLQYEVPNGDVNQNIFAPQVMMLGGGSVFAFLYDELKAKERWIHVICGALALWVALRTSCRTAYVAETALVILFCYLGHKKYRWSWRVVFSVVAVAILAMLLTVVCSPAVTGTKFNIISSEVSGFVHLQQGERSATSVGLRLAMWETALWEVIPKYFWFGVGEIGRVDFVTLVPKTKINIEFLSQINNFHNEGINLLVTGGVVLFAVANWLLYQLYKTARNEPVLLSLLVGTVAFGMTEVVWLHKNCFLTLVSMWLLYECAMRHRRSEARH